MKIRYTLPCYLEYLKELIKKIEELKHEPELADDIIQPVSYEKLKRISQKPFSRYLYLYEKTVFNKSNLEGIMSHKINHFIDPKESNHLGCSFLNGPANLHNFERCFEFQGYIDVMGFKAFNDIFGESAGDILIAYMVHYVTKILNRKGYLVVRKGGDEISVYPMLKKRMLCIREGEYFNNFIEDLKGFFEDDERGKEEEYKEKIQREGNEEDSSIVRTDLKNMENHLKDNVIHMIVPKNHPPTEYLLEYDAYAPLQECVQTDYKPKEYRYKILIKGLNIRTGVDKEADDAVNDAKKEKSGPKSSIRGNFDIGVELGFNVKGRRKIQYFPANEFAFFVIHADNSAKKIMDSMENIFIKKDFEEKDIRRFRDKTIPAYYFIIKKSGKSKQGNGDDNKESIKDFYDKVSGMLKEGLADEELEKIFLPSNTPLFSLE